MTKSISVILQESLSSEENFLEEAEYELTTSSNLKVKKLLYVCMLKSLDMY